LTDKLDPICANLPTETALPNAQPVLTDNSLPTVHEDLIELEDSVTKLEDTDTAPPNEPDWPTESFMEIVMKLLVDNWPEIVCGVPDRDKQPSNWQDPLATLSELPNAVLEVTERADLPVMLPKILEVEPAWKELAMLSVDCRMEEPVTMIEPTEPQLSKPRKETPHPMFAEVRTEREEPSETWSCMEVAEWTTKDRRIDIVEAKLMEPLIEPFPLAQRSLKTLQREPPIEAELVTLKLEPKKTESNTDMARPT